MAVVAPDSTAGFYDGLAQHFHRLYPDWAESVRRQGDCLDALICGEIGSGPHTILDCAVGIGTQLLGLAGHGHRMHGSDTSNGAVQRARRECAERGVAAALVVADMRALPFDSGTFDVVVCADNSLPHLLQAEDVRQALREMRRVVTPGGLIVVTTRDYDTVRATHPVITPPQLWEGPDDTTITLQLWRWHPDGRRYDLRHLQLTGDTSTWRVTERRTVYWAITRDELTGLAAAADLASPRWYHPDETGFFQPIMLGRVPAGQ
jgi:SAM-dependent methyltransferase